MLLEIDQLVKRYHHKIVVDHLSLKIREGEIMGLLGPNGAGKTTTINMITGLTKIDQGSIKIFGQNLEKSGKAIKKGIGLVPQDIAIFDDLNAWENIAFFGGLYGLKGNRLKEKVQWALEFVGLKDHQKQFPKKFSGGMKRRLNIACAIVHQPKLIIMDEPTVGIDPQSRNHILESVRRLNREGSTILYTSHYMEEVDAISSKIAIMDQGRVMAQGTSDELKKMISSEDRILLTVSDASYSMMEKIKNLQGVIDCHGKGKEITILAKKDSALIGQISQIISNMGAEIHSLQVEKVTLESVFLTLTGKTLRDRE
ncbi:ABC transporter ATP-binding protein [Tindallia californiensis]|uniref:ABC-2 type transport system ATP-binding protein n=1 Tax=Tindallia californiensis TaxID=159292 RepID=A0A1H3IZD6_9FIRM|nr:ABC transporter ATP-binding protein [Tindallia californiensis]SDY33071.1 ABC-2 type transport system ATP-binding protein [Tindallia californiensis]